MLMGYDKGLAAGLLAGAVTESATIGSASDAINRLDVPRRRQGDAGQPPRRRVLRHLPVRLGGRDLVPVADGARDPAHRPARPSASKKERELSGGKEELEAGRQRRVRAVRRPRLPRERVAGIVGRTRRGDRARVRAAASRSSGSGRATAVIDAEPDTAIREGDVVAVVGRREAVLSAAAARSARKSPTWSCCSSRSRRRHRRHQQARGTGGRCASCARARPRRAAEEAGAARAGSPVPAGHAGQPRRHAPDHRRAAQRRARREGGRLHRAAHARRRPHLAGGRASCWAC